MTNWVNLIGNVPESVSGDAPAPAPYEPAAPLAHRDLSPLIDPFGRRIRYLRLSVTDRCNYRCTYCMPEAMKFLPKAELLTIEELSRLGMAFIARGTRKIRITGGEPLIRRNVMTLFENLATALDSGGLEELTLTTNGDQLARYAADLYGMGVRRVNVSLDTLLPDLFERLTRRGDLSKVLGGIEAAASAGLQIKINMVALRDINDDEIPSMIRWAHGRGFDLTLIETMPLGEITGGHGRHHLRLDRVRERLAENWTLTEIAHQSGGPARYLHIAETGGRLGLITPLSHNFCESCNRVRVTCTGTLYLCLGQEESVDLRAPLRQSDDDATFHAALDRGIAIKPKGHDFVVDRDHGSANLTRHMSMTGG